VSPQNIQTYILEASFIVNVIYAILSKNGLFVLQRYIHLTICICILKGTIVSLTSYPNPNPVCSNLLENKKTILEIMKHVFGTIPQHSCGNLMFSGHAASQTLLFLIEGKYNIIKNANTGWFRVILFIRIIKTLIGYYSIIACRSHYTADVIIGIFMSTFLFIVSETKFTTSKIISTIEMQPYKKIVYINEYEDEYQNYIFEQL
jgi:hypothetical protein